jgi:TfoX/Sxy family transcriptional regulator of competence genes
MPYDEKLAERVRKILGAKRGVTERKMFGGLAFLERGLMCCGIAGRDLMVRVPLDRYEAALARPHARPMDFTGRPMRGFLFVAPAGVRTEAALRRWVEASRAYVATLPPKRTRAAPRGAGG